MKTSAFFRGWTGSTRTLTSLGATAGLTLASLTLGGCVVSIGDDDYSGQGQYAKISSSRMDSLVDANRGLRLGMSAREALALYPEEYVSLKSSSRVDGRVVEEWQVVAYDRRRSLVFRRWLYFVDGELVEFGDARRGLPASGGLPAGWGGSG